MQRTIITGTGSYIPEIIRKNADFGEQSFFGEDRIQIQTPTAEITAKFQEITGIAERRYAPDELLNSDLGYAAAVEAIADSKVDPETLDYIIVAHNYGDVEKGSIQSDTVPSIASRIKHRLGIQNPSCVAYDVLFGCPGWIQGIIQSHIFMKAGEATKCLVIGTETLSRVIDHYDRDSMIFSDGAGAAVLEYRDTDDQSGILSHCAVSHTAKEAYYLYFDKSNHPEANQDIKYIKMKGRKVYEYAMTYVPDAMKLCLDKAGIDLRDVSKIFIHQANEKLDQGVVKRLYRLYNINTVPEKVMPMNVHKYGNNSVATIPTLFDTVRRGKQEGHEIKKGDIALFASVGAGMNINAFCYRV